MEAQRLSSSLISVLKVRAVQATQAVIAADHQGYHHTAFDWWLFDAFMTSPKTCLVCKALNLTDWRGDWVPVKFPYHRHVRVNMIKASVHNNCRCRLHWAGRAKEIYNSPLGFGELWKPTGKELERLSPSQLQYVMQFLRNPSGVS